MKKILCSVILAIFFVVGLSSFKSHTKAKRHRGTYYYYFQVNNGIDNPVGSNHYRDADVSFLTYSDVPPDGLCVGGAGYDCVVVFPDGAIDSTGTHLKPGTWTSDDYSERGYE